MKAYGQKYCDIWFCRPVLAFMKSIWERKIWPKQMMILQYFKALSSVISPQLWSTDSGRIPTGKIKKRIMSCQCFRQCQGQSTAAAHACLWPLPLIFVYSTNTQEVDAEAQGSRWFLKECPFKVDRKTQYVELTGWFIFTQVFILSIGIDRNWSSVHCGRSHQNRYLSGSAGWAWCSYCKC